MNFKNSDTKRFWSKVAITANTEQCWEWQAGIHKRGYGKFRVGRNMVGAHRVAYELTYGEIPNGLFVCHNCPDGDNRKCVNPLHLFLATNEQNIADRDAKGRTARGDKSGRNRRGESNGRAKLTVERVHEIRTRFASGGITLAQLANEQKVASSTIKDVITFKTWEPKCRRCNDIGCLSITGDSDVPCPECGIVEMSVSF